MDEFERRGGNREMGLAIYEVLRQGVEDAGNDPECLAIKLGTFGNLFYTGPALISQIKILERYKEKNPDRDHTRVNSILDILKKKKSLVDEQIKEKREEGLYYNKNWFMKKRFSVKKLKNGEDKIE